jgi:hypothetical protein
VGGKTPQSPLPIGSSDIKVVAVKTLVVEFWARLRGLPARVALRLVGPLLLGSRRALYCVRRGSRTFTLKKLECLKQADAGIH